MADIEMPQLGETVTEGTITKWFKRSATRSPRTRCSSRCRPTRSTPRCRRRSAGYLAEIRVPEGDTVDVGTVLAVVADAPPAGGAAPRRRAGAEPPAEAPRRRRRPPSRRPPPPRAAPPPPPRPRRRPPRRRPPPAPAPAAGAAAPAAPATAQRRAGCCRRVVRRLIDENGLDPATINGTGVGGRITRDDVEQAIGRRRPAGAGRAAPRRRPRPRRRRRRGRGPRRSPPAPRSGTGDTVEPLNNIRRRTGEHMVMSKATSPHAMTVVEVDYENVERVRRRHRDDVEGERGLQPHLPAVHRPGRDRRPARVPAHERHRRRRRAGRAQLREPGDRRRPRLQGPAGAGHPRRRRQAAAGHRPRDQRPGHPGPHQEAVGRRHHRRHVHHLQLGPVRHASW